MSVENLELFDVVSDPIIGLDYVEYKLKTFPNKISAQKTLFLIAESGKAYVLSNGILTDQTQFYQTLKTIEASPQKKELGKVINSNKMQELIEKIQNNN